MHNRAVLLINLGSPDSYAEQDVQNFLEEFLMDKHVVDLPWLFRWLLVKNVIVPRRKAAVSKAYKSIWLDQGSPLKVLTQSLADKLHVEMGVSVFLGMRYGQPSIAKAVYEIKKNKEIDEVLVLPLYPHHAGATVKTALEQVERLWKKYRVVAKFTPLPVFYDKADYIDALVQSAKPFLEKDYDHIIFSYHGLPERHLKKEDKTGCHCLTPSCCDQSSSIAHKTCYKMHVKMTTKAFVKKANIPKDGYTIAFQSRVGFDKWLKPYTSDVVKELAEKGVKKLLIICPSFIVDCLETLEEINLRMKALFLNSGGESFTLIPCLNDNPYWVKKLKDQIEYLTKAGGDEPVFLPHVMRKGQSF